MNQIHRLMAVAFHAHCAKGLVLLAFLAGPLSASSLDGNTSAIVVEPEQAAIAAMPSTSPSLLQSPSPLLTDERTLQAAPNEAMTKAMIATLRIPRGKNIDPVFVRDVFAEICRLGIREPQIVMRQAMLETGWLRAPFLMKRNNLFGFRYRTYLSFPHWKDSVRYYRDWQARRYKSSDVSYYAFLTRIRYGVPSYVQHVKKIRWDSDCSLVLEENSASVVSTPESPGDTHIPAL